MLSTQTMEQICSLANVRVKPFDGTVSFYDKPYGVRRAWQVRNDGELIATYARVMDETRAIYPEGQEHSHTTFYGRDLTYDFVLEQATRLALGKLQDGLTRKG